MDELTAPLDLTLPGEARLWWGWHDGVSAAGIQYAREREMNGGRYQFLPLAEAVAQALERRRMAAEIAGDDAEELWRATWLPLSENAGGGAAVLDCSSPHLRGAPVHSVDWHRRGDFSQPSTETLGELIAWWIEAFDDGTYAWSEEHQIMVIRVDVADADRLSTLLI